ncbi:hypothetical protein RDWZM_000961 [Blomia tropicalis]|uniref:Inhibitor of growth protein N-terminal histone-binding domain-containing protein n=1 Tax=Blomia tropicalis TaxID=40697 RepID=A0A9Q0RQX9_BLOTA|nr:hypothetical protein RDWZM_000961 [Blomia tropicalis]
MLYLEDYLEMIEHLPQQFRDTLTQMRELDLQAHNERDIWEARVNNFFSNAHLMTQENRDNQFDQQTQDFQKILEITEENVTTATKLIELIEKYSRKLDQETLKFKIELEADHAGITEILEKRSLEMDHPPNHGSNHLREKRKMGLPYNLNAKQNDKLPHSQSQYQDGNVNSSMSNNFGSSKNLSNNQSNPGSSLDSFPFFNSNFFGGNESLNGSNLKLFKSNLVSNSSMIAAVASQAITATNQSMQLGRRSQSMKASIEAINNNQVLPTSLTLNSVRLDDSDLSNQAKMMITNGDLLEHMNSSNSNNKKSRNKRNRASSQYEYSSSIDMMADEGSEIDKPFEHELPLSDEKFCICSGPSYGNMICCDNNNVSLSQISK